MNENNITGPQNGSTVLNHRDRYFQGTRVLPDSARSEP